MIFVCTGSRGYQFDRLVKKLDELVVAGRISDDIYAQIGDSTYKPTSFMYTDFLNSVEFEEYQKKASLIITHGGTGAIVGALKKGKSVIGVPRLAEFGESIDDHQKQIVGIFEKENYIKAVYNIDDLLDAIQFFDGKSILKEYSRESNVIKVIDEYIERLI